MHDLSQDRQWLNPFDRISLKKHHYVLQTPEPRAVSRGGRYARNRPDSHLQALKSEAVLRDWLWQRGGKFGLDRFKSRLQALVDGHELETLNPFASQYEGGKMKGIQCSQWFPWGNLASPLAH